MTETMGGKELLTTFDAAKFLEIHEYTLQSWRRLKKGPTYIKKGRNVYYHRKDLEEFSAQMTTTVQPRPVIPYLISGRDVRVMIGIKSSEAFKKMIENGIFPQPVKIDRFSRWPVKLVEAWIDSQVKKTYGTEEEKSC